MRKMARKTLIKKGTPTYSESLEGLRVGDVVRFNEKGHELAFNAHHFSGAILHISTRTIVEVEWTGTNKKQWVRFEWSKCLCKATVARRKRIT